MGRERRTGSPTRRGQVYQDSRAPGTAISDIFGEIVELLAYGSHDWIIGSGIPSPPGHGGPQSLGEPGTF